MRLSLRNQLPGTVAEIEQGGVLSVVKVDLDGGQRSPRRSPTTRWRTWVSPPAGSPCWSSRPRCPSPST